ncbi:MAG: MATE family efflux transporter, partial [Paracoccaceae bacterium]
VMAMGLLRGVHDTRVPMWIAGGSYWLVGIPISYLLAFPAGLGAVGLWLGLVAGLAVAALALMARFWRRDWIAA